MNKYLELINKFEEMIENGKMESEAVKQNCQALAYDLSRIEENIEKKTDRLAQLKHIEQILRNFDDIIKAQKRKSIKNLIDTLSFGLIGIICCNFIIEPSLILSIVSMGILSIIPSYTEYSNYINTTADERNIKNNYNLDDVEHEIQELEVAINRLEEQKSVKQGKLTDLDGLLDKIRNWISKFEEELGIVKAKSEAANTRVLPLSRHDDYMNVEYDGDEMGSFEQIAADNPIVRIRKQKEKEKEGI